MTTSTKTKLRKVVDELGALKAQISNLKKRKAELEEQLLTSGEDEVDGVLFRATVSRYDQKYLDQKKLLETFGQTFIDAYSSTTEVERVNVTSRKTSGTLKAA